MADRLEDLLRACTVRVTGGPMPGTGFFIAPGKILTCAHVIGDSPALIVRWERDGQPLIDAPVSGQPVVLAGLGRPIPALDRDYPDIAVVEVVGLDGHPCVSIDPGWPGQDDRFQVFGYPGEGGAARLTPARLTYRGTHGTMPTAFLDLASDAITPGMSGAAVLNLRTGGVCGVVAASKHPACPDGALAIPWSAIGADLGEVLAAGQAFHLQDLRWGTAAGHRDRTIPGQGLRPGRVFISYAHDDPAHEDRVRDFWLFLRAKGIDAHLDLTAGEQRVDWAQWMTQEVRDADRVLVIASPQYRRRAEGDAGPDQGRGVQWEARLIREVFYADQGTGLQRIVPVILPDCSAADIPLWLAPASATHYQVSEYSLAGAEKLLRLLTRQPGLTVPPLGPVPVLPPRDTGTVAAVRARQVLHTEVVIEAALSAQGLLESAVWVAGSLLCGGQAPLPAEVARVWDALTLPALAAGQRMADAGRRLARALLDDPGQELLAELLDRLPPGGTVEVVLTAGGAALSLPVELIRLVKGSGEETGPLGLLPAVTVARRPAAPVQGIGIGPGTAPPAVSLAGPLKVLVAVAAPDETKTPNAPLDAEVEMAAVLDAVAGVAAGPHPQVRILEVASLPAIRQALAQDACHVLHLSAHGSPELVELEDEDGAPVQVTSQALMQALRHAGRPVPLIVLSSCSGGAAGSQAMAAGLIAGGADRVIAMLAPVTDEYATTLARRFYQELSGYPALTAGQALARARYLAEEDRRAADPERLPVPEYGVATLLAAGHDGPLVDPGAPRVPLTIATTPPGGKLVRDLPMGALIGRRAQMRTTVAVLRRTPEAVERFGVAGGVVLTGVGGIGKTAVAGRVISRLGDDGWLIAVHEGRWNPTALITATARALGDAVPGVSDPVQAAALRGILARLADPGGDDEPKLAAVAGLLASQRLLVVLDDFEQNLAPGGDAFLDPAFDEAITALADAADTGALLLTSRYPLPGTDRLLHRVPVPALSGAELQRLFLRMPTLRDLDAEDRRVLMRTIGGHPRLIEFTDALLRGGHASFKHVQVKLRDLARAKGLDLSRDRSLETVLDQAMLLGSADILLTELVALLTTSQAEVLRQVAVCRAPMTPDDLAFALAAGPDAAGPAPAGKRPDPAVLRADMDRLTDLTLLTADDGIVMHPWTAALVTRNTEADLSVQHQRALAMRLRRFGQQRGNYHDLIDIPRHLAALHRYDDIAGIAAQATQILPGTLATVACLAEIRPLIPPTERAWIIVGPRGRCPPSRGRPAVSHPAAASHPPAGPGPGGRRPRQHPMATRPVRQPQQAGGRGGGSRGPDRRPRRLPGRPGHRRTAGSRRPRQHPMATRPADRESAHQRPPRPSTLAQS